MSNIMDDLVSGTVNPSFRANQIICLEHDNACLYGEAIQLVAHRGLCWFRPLCLVVGQNDSSPPKQAHSIDLQAAADLLWPAVLFRPALDTEVLDYLTLLQNREQNSTERSPNKQYLTKFVRQVWLDNRDKF